MKVPLRLGQLLIGDHMRGRGHRGRLSKLAGNVSQGHLPTAEHVTSISQMDDLQTENQPQLWRDAEGESKI